MTVQTKDPQSVVDYTVDWGAGYLQAGETIVGTPVWTVDPSGELTVSSQSNTTTAATAFVTGGVLGRVYLLTCQVVTTQGRTVERSIAIRIEER